MIVVAIMTVSINSFVLAVHVARLTMLVSLSMIVLLVRRFGILMFNNWLFPQQTRPVEAFALQQLVFFAHSMIIRK